MTAAFVPTDRSPPTARTGWSARAADRLADAAFATAWSITSAVPEEVTARLLAQVADVVWRRHGRGVRQLEANLRRAVPTASDQELRALSRRALASYFRYWHEVFRVPSWPAQRIVSSVTTEGEERLREALAEGRGVVVALPHMANWDHAGAWACLTGMPVTTVAERLRPESLFNRFVGYRERLGMQVLPLTGGTSPGGALREALRLGRVVCLVADRNFGRSGVPVQLLGEPAVLPAGPAVLARVTQAPLFAVTLSYDGPALTLHIGEPVAARSGPDGLTAMMQEVADVFSAGIRRWPADWHMLQPVFAGDADRTAAGAPT
jgi:lauroyl/myristoyl acyltransferase